MRVMRGMMSGEKRCGADGENECVGWFSEDI
jgi:hypothetical protein